MIELAGRLLSARASLPVALLGAVVGALLLQVAAERLLGPPRVHSERGTRSSNPNAERRRPSVSVRGVL